MTTDRLILPITPESNVITTQNTYKLFVIPEVCYKGRWKKGCSEWKRTGYCKHTLDKAGRLKKRRIERYHRYKANISAWAKKYLFDLPYMGFSIYFYIPIPQRWSEKDRKAMHGQPYHRKSDIDNYLKAIFDSLTHNDERIAQLSGLGKFWVDTKQGSKRTDPIGPGWIEILTNQPIYNPFGVPFIDQSTIISLNRDADYNKRRNLGEVNKYVKDGAHKKNKFKKHFQTDELK